MRRHQRKFRESTTARAGTFQVATWPTVEAVIGKPLAFAINQAPPGRNTRSAEAGAGLGLLGVLAEPVITSRADHQDALADGRTSGTRKRASPFQIGTASMPREIDCL
ncbi:hypothetical protein [Bradyrhizobium sp. JYMT SZCCT0428]|uniref:hypothetical protein n=1 Tax=Bradyrhizobium sp. JYMT SZCCT0428 TaxID=2807673 RepID=UPI001BA54836|nr:hypothetical protein [Bradyrhizobium sp. JYMT SZCCT0428]MBR1157210.1 hypothetical protein [Bradyrhizobium sp. JYMT SZCCT0428]